LFIEHQAYLTRTVFRHKFPTQFDVFRIFLIPLACGCAFPDLLIDAHLVAAVYLGQVFITVTPVPYGLAGMPITIVSMMNFFALSEAGQCLAVRLVWPADDTDITMASASNNFFIVQCLARSK